MTTQRSFQVYKRESERTHSAFEHLIRTINSGKNYMDWSLGDGQSMCVLFWEITCVMIMIAQ